MKLKPWIFIVIYLVINLISAMDFEYHLIDNFGNETSRTALVDIDNDGDLDWVMGPRDMAIYWYEYKGADNWVKHVLYDKPVSFSLGAQAYDFNKDGHIDIFSGEKWYKNPGNPRTAPFIPYDAGKACHDNAIGDIDGDGIVDGISVFNSGSGDGFFWYKVGSNPENSWITNRIDTWLNNKLNDGIHGGVDPCGVGDLDGDGDNDIAIAHMWYENQNGLGTSWQKHDDMGFLGMVSDSRYGEMTKTLVVDFDKDGDLDVVQTEGDVYSGRVAWHENTNGDATSWTNHMIKDYCDQDFHSLCVEDFDNDGDLDIYSGGGPLSTGTHTCFIWENLDGIGGSFAEHILLTGKECHDARAGDVDGDGDIDICSKPWNGKYGSLNFYLKNMHVENGGTTHNIADKVQISIQKGGVQLSPNPFNPRTVISIQRSAVGNRLSALSPVVMIHDLNGKLIIELNAESRTRTADTYAWNASNLPGGLYIVSAQINNMTYTHKAFLTK